VHNTIHVSQQKLALSAIDNSGRLICLSDRHARMTLWTWKPKQQKTDLRRLGRHTAQPIFGRTWKRSNCSRNLLAPLATTLFAKIFAVRTHSANLHVWLCMGCLLEV